MDINNGTTTKLCQVRTSYRTFEEDQAFMMFNNDKDDGETHNNDYSIINQGESNCVKGKDVEEVISITQLAPGHITPPRAIFLISNAALGAGLVNFPEAYMKAGGNHVAITLQLCMLVFIVGAFLILARCADKYQAGTYQDVVFYVLGDQWKNFIQTCIVVYFLGTCITYVIIIGEQLSSVIEFASSTSGIWYTNNKILMVMFTVLFLLPLCVQCRLKLLSYTSCFGGIGAFFITAVIVRNYFADEYKPHPEYERRAFKWTEAFTALPCLCFGFQCHVSSVAVYGELKNRSASKFFGCAVCAMFVCAITYALSGGFGHATFGPTTKPDIMTNYANSDTLVNIGRLCILFILLSSFSIQMFCARNIIADVSIKVFKHDAKFVVKTERCRRMTITLTWFLIVLLLALVVPNISVAIAMISGIAAVFIFIIPGLCLLRSVDLDGDVLEIKDLVLVIVAVVYTMMGCFIFGVVTVLAVQRLHK